MKLKDRLRSGDIPRLDIGATLAQPCAQLPGLSLSPQQTRLALPNPTGKPLRGRELQPVNLNASSPVEPVRIGAVVDERSRVHPPVDFEREPLRAVKPSATSCQGTREAVELESSIRGKTKVQRCNSSRLARSTSG